MNATPFNAPSPGSLAARLPGYDIELLIEEGDRGAVYKGRQRSPDRDVAIRVLPREFGAHPGFRESFEAVVRAMTRLEHPNLIAVHDSGEIDGLPYIVMEFVRGKSLFHSAHDRAIDPAQAVSLVAGICRGLAHAHDHGIIHRDVRPGNILLTATGEPKLGGFGLARPAATGGHTAPEVARNPDHADRRSDIFSAGVILHELLTGRSPEAGCPPPSKIAGSDPALDTIWRTATRPDPADRYPSAAAMASALEMGLQNAAAPPSDRGRRRRMAARGTSTNQTLARNLVIIALLIVAISITWKKLKRAEATRVADLRNPAAATAAPAPPPVPEEVVEPEPPATEPSAPVAAAPAPPPPPAGTPALSLLRLRESLLAGKRDEMPVGTLSRGSTDFFLVTYPMTWPEARRFADHFGGHLAIVTSPADLEWFAARVSGTTGSLRSGHWVGARRTPDQGWLSADASPWPLEIPPRGDGQHAAIRRDGQVIAEDGNARHPFLIQWQRDGSNPARLAEILERTRESLASPSPVFPHDTLTAGERRVLIVRDPVTAADARELAELGGGHLYVPSSVAESDWLAAKTAGLNAPDGLWIGGARTGLEWQWHSGEPWTFGAWAAGAPSGENSALVTVPGAGWRDADPLKAASGYVIEWSREPSAATPPPAADTPAGLRAKAAELLATLDRQRQLDLAGNAESFGWHLDSWLRSNSKGDIARWKPGVDRLKAGVRENRVPSRLPRVPSARFPERMLKIARDALAKEQSIDEAFTAKAATLRDAYVERLAAIRDAEFERGQIDLARELATIIENAADTPRWAESFDEVARKIDTSLPPVTIVSASYGAGSRASDVTARVTRLVEKDRRDFHVNPTELDADPNPGRNMGLTIVYEIDGERHRKRWGENSEVKLSSLDGE